MSWKDYILSDILDLKYGKGLPERDRNPGDIPVYGSSGITGYHNKPLITGPSIIVGRKGTVGSVYYENRDFFPIDTVYYVEEDKSKINLKFTYYLLKTLPLKHLNTDAAVPGLNRNNALRVKCKVPSLKLQNRIVNVLSNYDDLIENNHRRIQLLEESARLLYQEWFVRFCFPGHEHVEMVDGLPRGWKDIEISTLAEFKNGKAINREHYCDDGKYLVMGSTSILGKTNQCMYEEPLITIGRVGVYCGNTYRVMKPSWITDNTIAVVTIDKKYYSLLYLFLYHQNLRGLAGGAAQPVIAQSLIKAIKMKLPDNKIILYFNNIVYPLFEMIENLTQYNEKLKEARDLLLPKLMSGEILV